MIKSFPQALTFDDVLLVPQYSQIHSRSQVDLTTVLSPKVTLKIPLISANSDSITGVEMAIAMGKLGGFGVLPRFDRPEIQADKVAQVKKHGVLTAASVGIKKEESIRVEMLIKAGVDIINIDVAHGHLEDAIQATRTLKLKYRDTITLISGIVATGKAAEAHYKAGADCVAVGVGSGSICTTRIQTGCGLPTFASLLDIAPVAKRFKKTFIPIAGIKSSGDIVKAFATGACACWCGNLLAGTDENPGDVVTVNGKKYKTYNGSTSKTEKLKQLKRLSEGKSKEYATHIEGVESLVPYKGALSNVVALILAGIRSGLSYSGATTILELPSKAHFVQISNSGFKDNGAHDVITIN